MWIGKLETIWNTEGGLYKMRLVPFYVNVHDERSPDVSPADMKFDFVVERVVENKPVEFLEIRSEKHDLYSWEKRLPEDINLSFPKYFVLRDDEILKELTT